MIGSIPPCWLVWTLFDGSTMTDLFFVCWMLAGSPALACTGVLPTYDLAAHIATDARHNGLSQPCIRRVFYTDAPVSTEFPSCERRLSR